MPYIRPGGKIIYLTSLWAHYYGEAKQPPGYESVARTKHAYEESSRARIPEFDARDVSFGVLCGHVITGTAAYSLFRLGAREYLNELEQTAEGGKFPTAEEMGQAARDMILNPFDQGYIRFVGGQQVEWLTSEETKPYTLNRDEIKQRLPMYGDSKLLVDSFDSPEDKQSGVGHYTVRDQDTEGHFGNEYSDIPLFRGVDQIEAATQTLGLIFLGSEVGTQATPLFRGIAGPIKFEQMVFPKDQIDLHARITERSSTGVKGDCEIRMGDTVIGRVDGIDLGLAPNIAIAKRLIRQQKAARQTT